MRGQRITHMSLISHFTETVSGTSFLFCFFFFQAEDGIRDLTVTGVQTCALPIFTLVFETSLLRIIPIYCKPLFGLLLSVCVVAPAAGQATDSLSVARRIVAAGIGRASCRGRG